MAEALARHYASDVIHPESAGISPFGRVAELTRRVLYERGVSCDNQYSKSVAEAATVPFDLIVNMTGMHGETLFPDDKVVDWDVEDPFGEDLATYNRICDDIEAYLLKLAGELRRKQPAEGGKK